tara:strand:- start:276 stop:458 length:183 start_codon:yes stop_codon:yes gene_type:complete
MEEIVNLIATDASATDISDKLKDVLFAKAAEKIDTEKASVATSMFDLNTSEAEPETSEEE